MTMPRTVITVSRSNYGDSARAAQVCVAVAARHGLTLHENAGWPAKTVEYSRASKGVFGQQYTGPTLLLSHFPDTAATVVIGDWSNTPERSALANDALEALRREFGSPRVKRRDDRWTEF
jgi:hypothetical protein